MGEPDYDTALRRRRIWGVPPDVVEQLIVECQRQQTELRARVKEREERLARVTTERDEANQTVASLQERIARLEQENQEIANRPEMIREEALRFVVDAWSEAQTLREQTRQEIEATETEARAEVAEMRRVSVEERQRHEAEMADERARYAAEMTEERQRSAAEVTLERQRYEAEMAEERQRYEAEIAVLRERRQRAITELESLAAGLLGQAARGAPRPSPTPPVTENAVPLATASLPAESDTPDPDTSVTAPVNGGVGEDQLLAKALDDLEAILNASRHANGA